MSVRKPRALKLTYTELIAQSIAVTGMKHVMIKDFSYTASGKRIADKAVKNNGKIDTINLTLKHNTPIMQYQGKIRLPNGEGAFEGKISANACMTVPYNYGSIGRVENPECNRRYWLRYMRSRGSY